MIYIVDGTGCIDDGDYAVSMAGGHCSMIHHLNKGKATYWRGPSMLDIWTRTTSIATSVFNELMSKEFPPAFLAPGAVQVPVSPIYLVGYSRGAAAMVMVAKMLAERKIPVAAMFLFDAVNRTIFNDLDMVPGNVEKCFHAIRNEGAQLIMEFEERQQWKKCEEATGFKEIKSEFVRMGSGSFEAFLQMRSARFPELHRLLAEWKLKAQHLKKFQIAMRNSVNVAASLDEMSIPFGNCARKHASVKEWEVKEFAGSHGALGGVPAENLGDAMNTSEREASLLTWTWMSGKMKQCGINAGRV